MQAGSCSASGRSALLVLLLRLPDHQHRCIRREEVERKDTSSADKKLYKRIAPGDIGYNTMRMWQGVSAVTTLEGLVGPAYTVCTPSEEVHPSFVGYLFKHPPVVHLFRRFSQGLVDDTLNLRFHEFAQIELMLPPVDEQVRIADVLTTIDQELDQLGRLRRELLMQKRGLIQKLLTGQVRVPERVGQTPVPAVP